MKTLQALLKSGVKTDPSLAALVEMHPQLVVAFAPVQDFEPDGRIPSIISRFAPGTLTIGCSTAGEISDGGVSEGSVVMTACKFEDVRVKTFAAVLNAMEDSYRAGRLLADGLDKKDLKALFILGPGLEINGSALLNGIKDVLGTKVIVTGGLAGDSGAFVKTFTLLNGEIAANRVVGFALYGDSIRVACGSMGGWEPFGPVRRVTKSKQNVLFEIDGEPALDLYKKYLGDAVKDLPASGLLYPFAILNENDDSTGLIRTILGMDEKSKSLTLAGDIPESGRVRLMHSTKKGLAHGAYDAAKLTAGLIEEHQGDSLALLISCVGRKLVMGTDIEDELDSVREVLGQVPFIGFYSYGEIGPQAKTTECKLHNQTMTITYLYEQD